MYNFFITPKAKKAAEYQVNLSAVNKNQNLKAKNAKNRDKSPRIINTRQDLAKARERIKIRKNERSWIFTFA